MVPNENEKKKIISYIIIMSSYCAEFLSESTHNDMILLQ